MNQIPEILAAFGFFGAIFICPLVWMLMRHQRAMAEVLNRGIDQQSLLRIEALEREVRELKASRQDAILRQEDQADISRRLQS